MEILTRKEAKAKGLKTYYTGKPCKHGHIAERRTSSRDCVQCHRLKSKEWREKNPERLKELSKNWYENNKDLTIQRATEWNRDNKEARSKIRKSYRTVNAEKVKEYDLGYRRSNRDKFNFWAAKRRTQKLNACPAWADLEEIQNFYYRAEELEEITGMKYHVDHIVPLQHELVCGLHVPENLQLLTAHENISKGNRFSI